MQLRTFLAKDMSEALAHVRDEMGPEAVILSTESAAGGVMVRAALDEDSGSLEDEMSFADDAELIARQTGTGGHGVRRHPLLSKRPSAHTHAASRPVTPPRARKKAQLPEPNMDTGVAGGLVRMPMPPPAAPSGAMVRTLREKNGRRRFDRGELLTIFAHHRLPDTLAHQLAETCAGTGINDMTLALAAAIDARMLPAPVDFSAAKAFLLLGLGGAGKTATAAKLAAHAQLAGRRVCLIAGDTEGAGAVARLKAFAEHLSADIETAATPTRIAEKVRSAVARGTLAVVDTAGFDPRQAASVAALMPLAKSPFVDTIGVVSALSDSEEMLDVAAALRAVGANRLIVTQLDLVRRFGAVAAAALADGVGFAHATRSPFVAGGLETLSPLNLARLLVENEEESVQ